MPGAVKALRRVVPIYAESPKHSRWWIHFLKSLRTKNWSEAKRLIKVAGWEYEELLRQTEGYASYPLTSTLLTPTQTEASLSPSPRPKAKSKTFEQVFELFINDPTRKRAKKTIAGYKDGIEIIYAVVGRQTPVGDTAHQSF